MKRSILTVVLVAVVAASSLGLAACSREPEPRSTANATVRIGNSTITTTFQNGTIR